MQTPGGDSYTTPGGPATSDLFDDPPATGNGDANNTGAGFTNDPFPNSDPRQSEANAPSWDQDPFSGYQNFDNTPAFASSTPEPSANVAGASNNVQTGDLFGSFGGGAP